MRGAEVKRERVSGQKRQWRPHDPSHGSAADTQCVLCCGGERGGESWAQRDTADSKSGLHQAVADASHTIITVCLHHLPPSSSSRLFFSCPPCLCAGFYWIPTLAGPTSLDNRGIEWLYPFVDGAPPIGWEAASHYLVLPVLLVACQYVSSAIVSPPIDPNAENANQQRFLYTFLPLMVGYFALNVPAGEILRGIGVGGLVGGQVGGQVGRWGGRGSGEGYKRVWVSTTLSA